jgi:uncharacterized protein with PIN domain
MVSQEIMDGQSGNSDAPRLIVDAMLGRLARWLRLAGYDAEFWREGSDEELIVVAHDAGRLIITKDRGLAGRRGVRALLIHADDLDGQIVEARAALTGLGPVPKPFTRCGECNGLLRELQHAEAESLVPPYVWHTQTQFWRCERCGRVYWKGTHWPGVEGRLNQAVRAREGDQMSSAQGGGDEGEGAG